MTEAHAAPLPATVTVATSFHSLAHTHSLHNTEQIVISCTAVGVQWERGNVGTRNIRNRVSSRQGRPSPDKEPPKNFYFFLIIEKLVQ